MSSIGFVDSVLNGDFAGSNTGYVCMYDARPGINDIQYGTMPSSRVGSLGVLMHVIDDTLVI